METTSPINESSKCQTSTEDEAEDEMCGDVVLMEDGDDNDNDNDGDKNISSFEGTRIQCPYVGMEFDTYEDAFSYYNAYARVTGFGTRRNSTRKSQRNGDVIGRRICCVFEGSHQSNKKGDGERQRNRASARTGCKAGMAIKKAKERKWVVSHIVDEHNHDLTTPSEVRNYRSHRYSSTVESEVIKHMQSSGVRKNSIMSSMANVVGGSHNKDIRNFLSSRRQKELKGGDVASLLQYLEAQQLDSPSFFYSMQVDSEGHLTNFFWADAKSRIDYHHFRDVVCFDPTYLTIRYNMPFALIIGINHHFQSIILGGALLLDETEESFAWVMSTWMRAVGNKQPRVIFTHQDSAIGGAISRIMPESQHRHCAWHILRNALKDISNVFSQYRGFKTDFKNCLYGGETIAEFESNWKNMLERYNLRENEWLNQLYEKRKLWAAAYSRDLFCAAMNTPQRSQSINSFFDKYLKKDMPLKDFVTQFGQAVKSQRDEETDADFITNSNNPVLKICMGLEEDGARVYTREIFAFFQEELISGLSYHHEWVLRGEHISKFLVWKSDKDASNVVEFDHTNHSASCSCKLFEYAGYLCRHVLKVFIVVDVQRLPPRFILKRWTKEAKYRTVVSTQGQVIQADRREPVTCRYANLCREGINLSAKAAVNHEVYELAMKGFQRTLEDVNRALRNVSLNVTEPPKDNEEPIMKRHKEQPKELESHLDKGGETSTSKKETPLIASNSSHRIDLEKMNTGG